MILREIASARANDVVIPSRQMLPLHTAVYVFQNSEHDSAISIAPHLMKQTVAISRILRHIKREKVASPTPVLHGSRRGSWCCLEFILENDPTVLVCSVNQQMEYKSDKSG